MGLSSLCSIHANKFSEFVTSTHLVSRSLKGRSLSSRIFGTRTRRRSSATNVSASPLSVLLPNLSSSKRKSSRLFLSRSPLSHLIFSSCSPLLLFSSSSLLIFYSSLLRRPAARWRLAVLNVLQDTHTHTHTHTHSLTHSLIYTH